MQGRKGNYNYGTPIGCYSYVQWRLLQSRGARTVVSFPVQTSPPPGSPPGSTVIAGSEMSVAKLYTDRMKEILCSIRLL